MQTRSLRALIDTPPVWLAGFAALAMAQARWLPLWPAAEVAPHLWQSPEMPRLLGTAMILFALMLFAAAAVEFRKRRTSIIPREAPRALLTHGPYAISRNPIYLADGVLLFGVVLWGDLASLPLVPLYLWLLDRRFVRGEETACRAAFGDRWDRYARKVGRWL